MSKKLYIDDEWFVRNNEELDDKLPLIASHFIAEKIDYRSSSEIEVAKMLAIMSEHLSSFDDMIWDEVMCAIGKIKVSCELVVGLASLEKDGLIKKRKNGTYVAVDKKSKNN